MIELRDATRFIIIINIFIQKMHDKRFTNIDQLYFNDINIYYIYVLAYNWGYLNKDSNFFEGIFFFFFEIFTRVGQTHHSKQA